MPPAPPRRMLRWQNDRPVKMRERHMKKKTTSRREKAEDRSSMVPMQAMMSKRQMSFDALELNMLDEEEDEVESLDPVQLSSVAEGGGGTATFNIERAVNIAADAKPHKVCVYTAA